MAYMHDAAGAPGSLSNRSPHPVARLRRAQEGHTPAGRDATPPAQRRGPSYRSSSTPSPAERRPLGACRPSPRCARCPAHARGTRSRSRQRRSPCGRWFVLQDWRASLPVPVVPHMRGPASACQGGALRHAVPAGGHTLCPARRTTGGVTNTRSHSGPTQHTAAALTPEGHSGCALPACATPQPCARRENNAPARRRGAGRAAAGRRAGGVRARRMRRPAALRRVPGPRRAALVPARAAQAGARRGLPSMASLSWVLFWARSAPAAAAHARSTLQHAGQRVKQRQNSKGCSSSKRARRQPR